MESCDIAIEKLNASYIRVHADPGIECEISEQFTFMVPGYQWSPKYQFGTWDGKIKLFNRKTKILPAGLIDKLRKFASNHNYTIDIPDEYSDYPFSIREFESFAESLNLPFPLREHQAKATIHAIRKKRATLVSATNSGKSMIIYLLTQFYDCKTLIIVPTIALTSQMESDFRDYGSKSSVHKITGGVDKNTRKLVTISTYQSLAKLPQEYFEQYDLVICDEVHTATSASITTIMNKCINADYRFGLTGTLQDSKCSELQIEGMFGNILNVISAKTLMDKGYSVSLKIKAIVLKYTKAVKKNVGKSYQEEVEFLVTNEKRNKFIVNLALSLKGNTMILFRYVDKHGKPLYDLLNNAESDKLIHYASGETNGDLREEIRLSLEKESNSIIVASAGIFSTGSNFKNLHNIILLFGGKSKIKILQSIGRGLRVHESKDCLTAYDIADDLYFSMKHLKERLSMYIKEQFNYKIYEVAV